MVVESKSGTKYICVFHAKKDWLLAGVLFRKDYWWLPLWLGPAPFLYVAFDHGTTREKALAMPCKESRLLFESVVNKFEDGQEREVPVCPDAWNL